MAQITIPVGERSPATATAEKVRRLAFVDHLRNSMAPPPWELGPTP